jgi:predicted RNase H-like nuclease (RuvC/YqgF family)
MSDGLLRQRVKELEYIRENLEAERDTAEAEVARQAWAKAKLRAEVERQAALIKDMVRRLAEKDNEIERLKKIMLDKGI